MNLKIKSLVILFSLLILTSVCSFGTMIYKMYTEVYNSNVLNLRAQTDQLSQSADVWMQGMLRAGQLFADGLGSLDNESDKLILQQAYLKQNPDVKKLRVIIPSSGVSDEAVLGDIFVNDETQNPAVAISFPVHDQNGHIAGAVSEELDLSYIQTMVSETKIGKTGLAAVVDVNGKLIAHRDTIYVKQGQSVPEALIQLVKSDSDKVITFKALTGYISYGAVSPIGTTGWYAQTAVPVEELGTVFYNSLFFGILALAVSLLIGGGAAVYLFSRQFRSLPLLKDGAEKIAGKDLNVELIRVKNRDEIGALANSFNNMAQNLRGIILNLRSNSSELTAYSQQLSGIAETTAASSEEAVAIIEGIASNAGRQRIMVQDSMNAIDEVNSAIRQISSTVDYSSQASEKATNAADIGFNAMQRIVGQMNTLQTQINGLADVIGRLEQRSGEIGQVSDYMTSISSQIRILALNATIESARAGEFGRGFAVVASEVQELANNSYKAAAQITDLIGSVQAETKHVSDVMKLTNIGVNDSIEVVSHADSSFQQLFTLVGRVNEKVLEMSAAARKIADSYSSVVQSVGFISNNTEETVTSVNQIAITANQHSQASNKVMAASKYLADTSADLFALLDEFRG